MIGMYAIEEPQRHGGPGVGTLKIFGHRLLPVVEMGLGDFNADALRRA